MYIDMHCIYQGDNLKFAANGVGQYVVVDKETVPEIALMTIEIRELSTGAWLCTGTYELTYEKL